jgi:hypothetical protein
LASSTKRTEGRVKKRKEKQKEKGERKAKSCRTKIEKKVESRSPDRYNDSTVNTRLQPNLRQKKLTSCYKPRQQKKYSLRSVTRRPARYIEEEW